ncbi:hypothetical protein FNV43_RR24659 [Rhamnella rubrinervis]|uniref:SHSP domain-containing protein n=1 Tax=Rhamnella rubrinervis TaxID=2594499 RepID=A0A8K0GLE9_9ROSA|nr:hypothetical protein FNV43_RR24659 [Rhamnella rubrinervis]
MALSLFGSGGGRSNVFDLFSLDIWNPFNFSGQLADDVCFRSAERSREKEETNDKWHRVERCSGKFLRRFRLPENAKMDQVKASMENGVLTVTVPKEEEKKPEI